MAVDPVLQLVAGLGEGGVDGVHQQPAGLLGVGLEGLVLGRGTERLEDVLERLADPFEALLGRWRRPRGPRPPPARSAASASGPWPRLGSPAPSRPLVLCSMVMAPRSREPPGESPRSFVTSCGRGRAVSHPPDAAAAGPAPARRGAPPTSRRSRPDGGCRRPVPATRAHTTVATAPTSRSGTGRARAGSPTCSSAWMAATARVPTTALARGAAVGDGDPHEGDRHDRPRRRATASRAPAPRHPSRPPPRRRRAPARCRARRRRRSPRPATTPPPPCRTRPRPARGARRPPATAVQRPGRGGHRQGGRTRWRRPSRARDGGERRWRSPVPQPPSRRRRPPTAPRCPGCRRRSSPAGPYVVPLGPCTVARRDARSHPRSGGGPQAGWGSPTGSSSRRRSTSQSAGWSLCGHLHDEELVGLLVDGRGVQPLEADLLARLERQRRQAGGGRARRRSRSASPP